VASMISTAVIPMICKVIEGGALDVYSQKHIVRMVDLAEEIEASLDPGNIKFQVRSDFSFNLIFFISNAINLVITQISHAFLPSRHCGNGNTTFQIQNRPTIRFWFQPRSHTWTKAFLIPPGQIVKEFPAVEEVYWRALWIGPVDR
jgi:hypothetical protein